MAALLIVAACAPAASPPTTAPAKSAATAAPAEAQKPAAKPATGRPTSVAEIALYKGPDREQILEEGARKEGQLQWYTSFIVDQLVRPIQDGFKKKYPYINVEFYRGNDTAERIINEYKAGRYEADLTDENSGTPVVKAANLLQAYYSPILAKYPDDLKDPEGMWGAVVQYFNVIGYNPKIVPDAEAPKTYEDLLNPKWRGKLAWTTTPSAGAPIFIGHILQTMGEEKGKEYLRKLKEVGVAGTTGTARAVLDQVIGGEFGIQIHAYLHHALISKGKGAPVAWTEPQPLVGTIGPVGLLKNAPHPHAAMLFLDFLFSEEGQKIIIDNDYAPAHPNMAAKDPTLKPPARGVKVAFMNPDKAFSERKNWEKLFQEVFVR